MKNLTLSFISLITASFLLTSCHFMEKKEIAKEELAKKSIAPVSPTFSFIKIPAGKFTMGSPESEAGRDSDETQVKVEITKPFEITATEVTQRQWFSVMRNNPSYFKGGEYCANYDSVNKLCPDHPVERVSWNDVQEYIKKLNDLQGLSGCEGSPKDPSGCYRLPTEAEWEYAARAGTKTAYFFGDSSTQLGNYAWYDENSGGRTHKVGTKAANSLGLHDVYGNVFEWVQDVYREKLEEGEGMSYVFTIVFLKQDVYREKLEEGEDPLSEGSLFPHPVRVVRGGSWFYYARYLRSADRFPHPDGRDTNVGFRLVRTL